MRFLALAFLLASCSSGEDPAATIQAADIRKHQIYLAADALEGRESGTKGAHEAAVYISDRCKALGLEPGGTDGFFQPFGEGQKNVVAVWKGTDRAAEHVILGAHYDHVGRGHFGSNKGTPGEIHNGADDNASGTSVLLDVAEAAVRGRFRRTVVFIWFDGEEKGLFGSKHWVERPTLPLDGCVGMVNCDMVGRNDTRQVFVALDKDGKGALRHPKWGEVFREAERKFGFPFDWAGADDLLRRSDQWPFMEKGIPAVFFTGGLHADYHTERDDVEKINFAKQELIGRIVYFVLRRVADTDALFK